ncbi:hypothetical protein GCM10022215_26490 [Nocardioides fonticola]|uniref:Lipoprotein n=1 Tax=Nocardioides fonticola TaxID=450363 RepID=A0ABP7XMN6_9ACTN
MLRPAVALALAAALIATGCVSEDSDTGRDPTAAAGSSSPTAFAPIELISPDTGEPLPATSAPAPGLASICLPADTYRDGVVVAVAEIAVADTGPVVLTAVRLSQDDDALVPVQAAYVIPSSQRVRGMPGLLPLADVPAIASAEPVGDLALDAGSRGHLLLVLRVPTMAAYDELRVDYRTADGTTGSTAAALTPTRVITAADCDEVRGVDPQT